MVTWLWAYAVGWGLMAIIAAGDKDVGSLAAVFKPDVLIATSIFALIPFAWIVLCQEIFRRQGALAFAVVSLLSTVGLVLLLKMIIISPASPSVGRFILATVVFSAISVLGSAPVFLLGAKPSPTVSPH